MPQTVALSSLAPLNRIASRGPGALGGARLGLQMAHCGEVARCPLASGYRSGGLRRDGMRLRRAPSIYDRTCSSSSVARRVYPGLTDPGSPKIALISSSAGSSLGSGSNEDALEDSSSPGLSHTIDASFSAHCRSLRASASCVSGGRARKTSTARSRSSVTGFCVAHSAGNLNAPASPDSRLGSVTAGHTAGAVPLNPVASR
jgi:hypothetical protein